MDKRELEGEQKCAIFLHGDGLVVKKNVHVVFESSPKLIKIQSRGRSEYAPIIDYFLTTHSLIVLFQ